MARPAPTPLDEDTIVLPRLVRFPVELRTPEGFDPVDPATWPDVEGRLECVSGRLLYTPPCGLTQQLTVTEVVYVLRQWAGDHPEFAVGSNEAGLHLAGDTRGLDAVVWRSGDLPSGGHKFVQAVPALAVEVAGGDDTEPLLREKARWYLAHGVPVVWLVLPDTREVLVLTPAGESRHREGETLPPAPHLPGLAPRVESVLRRGG